MLNEIGALFTVDIFLYMNLEYMIHVNKQN